MNNANSEQAEFFLLEYQSLFNNTLVEHAYTKKNTSRKTNTE